MALDFKIEWFRDGTKPTQEGMFVHTTQDLPAYQELIGKEDYEALDESEKSDYVTGLFAIPGVVEVSVKAYQTYVIKAELFKWTDLSSTVISYIGSELGESTFNELPGSRMTVETKLQRREL